MILTTPEELRLYVPTHTMEDLSPIAGYVAMSEESVLREKVGDVLWARVQSEYDKVEDKIDLLPDGALYGTIWARLIRLCQRVVAFDAIYRAIGSSGISVNAAGLNVASTGDYDAATEAAIDRFQKNLYREGHDAVNMLLRTLEEWSEDVGNVWGGEDALDPPAEGEDGYDYYAIVAAWKRSRYYYKVEGLLITTATQFQEFVDIYGNREKFISLLPDLRFAQQFVLAPELGDDFLQYLLHCQKTGTGEKATREALYMAQLVLALKTEERSRLFDRKEAHDEAIGAVKRLVDFLHRHQGDFPEAMVTNAPWYEPEPPAEVRAEAERRKEYLNHIPKWQNNRKGNKLFVTPAIE